MSVSAGFRKLLSSVIGNEKLGAKFRMSTSPPPDRASACDTNGDTTPAP